MDRDKFEELVKQGIEAIPKRFLEKLDNVDIVIENEPTVWHEIAHHFGMDEQRVRKAEKHRKC